jgi:hypothetical protein
VVLHGDVFVWAAIIRPRGHGCRATAQPGSGQRHPAILPLRLSVLLRQRADRRPSVFAVSAGAFGRVVAAVSDRGQRGFGRRAGTSACRRAAGCATAGRTARNVDARRGSVDAPVLRRRLSRLLPGCAAGWWPRTGLPRRERVAAVPVLPGRVGRSPRGALIRWSAIVLRLTSTSRVNRPPKQRLDYFQPENSLRGT